ncbi:MAG: XRE family transcriptional regulator [Thermodesulfobacteriota bacterium]
MAKKFSELRAKMSPESRRRANERARALMAEMPLQELRNARHLTQEALATALGKTQPQISKLEKQSDLYVSTLRSYIRAMGGELDIVARFPDGAVKISQFEELEA